MGVATLAKWMEGKPLPYRADPTRANGIKRGYKKLRLGMTLEEVNALRLRSAGPRS
jgi:hypothetical protein